MFNYMYVLFCEGYRQIGTNWSYYDIQVLNQQISIMGRQRLHMSVEKIREGWERGEKKKYQLVGDNWDRNILPSYRTSQQKTISLHLFQVVCVVDRINPVCVERPNQNPYDLKCIDFIPSMQDQNLLCKELTFIVATALLNNIDQLKNIQNIYPKHLEHQYSAQSGLKTHQVSVHYTNSKTLKVYEIHVLEGRMVVVIF